jgi:hypothetical protein
LPLSANAQSRKKQHSTISHCAVLFLDYNLTTMIKSFADALTEKVFLGEDLTRKEARLLGDLRLSKAQERLVVLHHSTEKDLMKLHALHYHSLRGAGRYSILTRIHVHPGGASHLRGQIASSPMLLS